ncbi:MAG: TolC family protein [Gammaproteobacteria bacterium]|nr:TolC family protein [Pseudomonadales bacterium]MCP5346873.1 TolC family protein [Pseudomonadales bacterium]
MLRNFLSMLLVVVMAACTSGHYRQSADNETYTAIADKTALVPGMTREVDLDPAATVESVDLSAFAQNQQIFEFLDNEAESEVGGRIISLNDALELAFLYSREYQTQKERLYLQALALTFDRYRYTPVFSFTSSGDYRWDSEDQFVVDMQELTGMQRVNTSESIDAGTTLGSRWLLKGGGVLALTLTNNFTRFLTGDIRETGSSALFASFAQPLIRDFGTAIETENLMQAERDLLYQLRDFTRFRKSFAVRIASNYYSVLLNREITSNNYSGLQAVNLNLEREQAFQAEGLRTLLQVGRLEQQSLQQRLRWTTSITRYKRSLDNFKILIGLRASDNIVLDDNELQIISETGMTDPDLDLDRALEMSLQTRLDLYSELDRVQDSARKIRVAANQLKPALDFNFDVAVSGPDDPRLGELDFENAVYTAGLSLDLPLDTKFDRNELRRALINYDASTRTYLAAVDQVKLTVIDDWRRMDQALKNYEINVTSVEINERRVEEAQLRAELGLGDIQDTVDSQNDLIAARTELISTIVEHNTAKLEFWRDIGLLYVDDSGQWEEGVNEPR